jgi:hypothetical protein
MRYNKPKVTQSMNAASAIHQISWTTHTVNGVAKTPSSDFDSQTAPQRCLASAYEADE